MMKSSAINYYNQHAEYLVKQYLSLNFEQVHRDWCDLLDSHFGNQALNIVDVGAGSGRDAFFLAKHNRTHQVWAVEPAIKLAAKGQQKKRLPNLKWLDDQLPHLNQLSSSKQEFDLILLSAVWMHLDAKERAHSMSMLAGLLAESGLLVISLRHGHSEQEITERQMHHITADELIELANHNGLSLFRYCQESKDELKRGHVYWETVVLTKNPC